MQHNELSLSQCPIYIEFEHSKKRLHISFPTEQDAAEALSFFPDMSVMLQDNRIIIECGLMGVHYCFSKKDDFIKLRCNSIDNAKSVYDFIQGAQSVLTNNRIRLPIAIHKANDIEFPTMLHPDFNFEKRIETYQKIMNQCAYTILMLSQYSIFLPKELMLTIGWMMFELGYSADLGRIITIMTIHRQFKTPNDKVKSSRKKIECEIVYRLSDQLDKANQLQYNTQLICLSKKDALTLSTYLTMRRFDIDLNQNIVTIKPIYFKAHSDAGFDFKNGIDRDYEMLLKRVCGGYIAVNERCMGIQFRGPVEAATFFSLVHFKQTDVIVQDKSIIFLGKSSPHLVERKREIFAFIQKALIEYFDPLVSNNPDFFKKRFGNISKFKKLTDSIVVLRNHIGYCMHFEMSLNLIIDDFMVAHGAAIMNHPKVVDVIRELSERFGDKCSLGFKRI